MARLSVRADTTRFSRPPLEAVELAGQSAAIGRVRELLRRAATTDGAVLFVGEQGTDVPGLAAAIHAHSTAPGAPFVRVDCAGREAPDLDRELFGAPIGAAPSDLDTITSDSRLAAARGGTLFLHEVTELPSAVQARLARILRDREVRLRGDAVPTAFRLVADAPPAIDADLHAQRFRADLYRRLAATRIDVPPLRDRAEDVPALAARILDELGGADARAARTFSHAALALLGAVMWLGNLAELRGVIERVAAAAGESVILIEHVLPALQLDRAPAAFVPAGNLREARLRFEREYIAAVLQHHRWRMADAAHTLGIQRPNLYRKARQLGILLSRTSA
jgi:DNA-binding NtrC family response regulator